MIFGIYGLWDRKAHRYLSTFTETNDDTAKRNFDTIRKDNNTLFGKFPEDFELYRLGNFDDNTGITSIENTYLSGGGIINNE